MIPSRPNGKMDKSPRLPAKHGINGKNNSKSPKGLNNDIKRFHKATAQQYKDYIKKNQNQ